MAECDDSDDDWFTKDVESFTSVPSAPDLPVEEVTPSTISKEQLLELMKSTEIGGAVTYKAAKKVQSQRKTTQKASSNNGKGDELFVQKLPITILASIAGKSPVKSFTEAFIHEDELAETIMSAKLTNRYAELITVILENIFGSPFTEHKTRFLEKILNADTYWENLLKPDADQKFARLKECLELSKDDLNVKNVEILKEKLGVRFKNLPEITPTRNELLTERPSIQTNIVEGKFSSSEAYRTLQLALLKEDFVASIRESIEKYNKMYDEPTAARVDGIKVQLNIKLRQGNPFGRCQEVYIAMPKGVSFLHGALLIFTTNTKTLENFVLATVQSVSLTGDEEENLIPLEIIHCEATNIFAGELVMIEPEVFFAAYYHSYRVMATIREIPFENYLVNVKESANSLPKYVKNVQYTYHGATFDITGKKAKNIKRLNASQKDAYLSALSREFALIQGPPGTGKTFIGLEIVKTLLANTKEKILVVCYTNHALDQFLYQLSRTTKDIVRFGMQSKNRVLDEFNIKELPEENTDGRLYYKTRDKYREWMKRFIHLHTYEDNPTLEAILEAQQEMHSYSRRLDEIHQIRLFHIINSRRIIGMTTSFAARSHALLDLLNIPIVIFEEAAEVLEAHIVSALTPHTQHAILVGDHHQLRPQTSVYRLAQDLKMDISLFERMVNNNMACKCLLEQHRMRPEISNLIRNTIYAQLDDAHAVTQYPNVSGMSTNLFFLDHTEPEKRAGIDTTKTNKFEAREITKLCKYLLEKGHSSKEITILTPYLGQAHMLKGMTSELNVRVAVVDNYQGEENNIILLSLVRSNKNSSIGYLERKNRICVALSRAKMGLYICGNMTLLSSCSTIWKEISDKLQAEGRIGGEFPYL